MCMFKYNIYLPTVYFDSSAHAHIQIFAVAKLFGDSSEGPSVTVNELFQPLPYPEKITITAINLCLIGAGSIYTFSVNWETPQFQTDIDNYEISFSHVPLRAFDRFEKRREECLIASDLTQFQKTFSGKESSQLIVQV